MAVSIDTLRAEVERLESDNAQLRHLIDQVPVAMLVKDCDSRVLYMNAAGAIGYGCDRDELIGKREPDLLPPGNDVGDYFESDRQVVDTGVGHVIEAQPFRDHEGRQLTLHITKFRIRFDGQDAVMVVALDFSQAQRLAELERSVSEKQRLESLGVLAGGIAHDFNNLLVGVLAHADLALRVLATDTERATLYIERLKGAALRLSELSRQMLAYSGRGKFETELVDLSAVVQEMLELTSASIPKNVTLRASLEQDLPRIEVDPAQLRQVLLNLITNAADAYGGEAGEVRVRTELVGFDPTQCPGLTLGSDLEAGPFVQLTVRDAGGGMDRQTLDRMFDPFYTTKASGRGLGLASVLGIVRAHRGALGVESQVGRGSEFRIWLPVAEDQTERPTKRTRSTPPNAIARCVLVVDDEPLVRQATRAILEASALEVCTAEDGLSALETIRAQPQIDVLMLDVTMPGPSVTQTHADIRRARPQLPILLTSGFSEQDSLAEVLADPLTLFIEKPYSSDALLDALEALSQLSTSPDD